MDSVNLKGKYPFSAVWELDIVGRLPRGRAVGCPRGQGNECPQHPHRMGLTTNQFVSDRWGRKRTGRRGNESGLPRLLLAHFDPTVNGYGRTWLATTSPQNHARPRERIRPDR